jgi:predicted CoA-binding protein
MKKTTIILGASPKSDRYSYLATERLVKHGHPVFAVGQREGIINETPINTKLPENQEIDTVTLYLNPSNQEAWYQQILDLKPKRIIFNPGTENPTFEKMAAQEGIETTEACTLVLLASDQY